MGAGTLDDKYLTWLYSQVAEVRTRKSSKTYWNLLRRLYCTEFAWFVPNDDNRAEDGRALRVEWAAEQNIEADHNWLTLGCSFLEMLIGLSRRLEFETGSIAEYWFWRLINNLGLSECNDRNYCEEYVDEVANRVIWRTYEKDGNGGLFPLYQTERNQRRVELWYQLSEYLSQEGM